MDGWIKIHRKMLENPIICKDSEHLSIWMYLLLNATHKEVPAIFKGKKIILQPGQLITGRKIMSQKLKIKESKIYRVINEYKSEHQIEQQTSNQNSLISIVNWHKYQQSEQQIEQPVNNQRTTSEHKQEYKEDKNIYLLLLNKYKRKTVGNFSEYVKAVKKLKEDTDWQLLNEEEQRKLISQI